jgi:hypothetical protein
MTFKRSVRFKNQILAFWKRCFSFRKRDWQLSDYPVAIREQKIDPDSQFSAPRFTQHRYIAYIVNWALTGGGGTPQEALHGLQNQFESVKDKWKLEAKPLVRPGTRGPIEFASQDRISVNQELSEDFIRRVLELDWAWISDESSLWDFHTSETNELLCTKIMQVYGVDVSDIESGKLSEILDRIAATRASALLRYEP